MNGLFGALSRLLERLEAEDVSGAAMVLSEVKAQLCAVTEASDLLELRLLNARCQEAAKRLAQGLETRLHEVAASNRAVSAYSQR